MGKFMKIDRSFVGSPSNHRQAPGAFVIGGTSAFENVQLLVISLEGQVQPTSS